MMNNDRFCYSLLTFCLLFSGCSDRPELAKVKGTVTLDGKPLSQGSIVFEMPDRRPATGTITGGQIVEVTTYDQGDGAPVGQHKIAIAATSDAAAAVAANPGDATRQSGNYMSGTSLIPTLYNDPNTSGLTAEIQPGENTLQFKLVSNPPR
jgi:hypothetical protein